MKTIILALLIAAAALSSAPAQPPSVHTGPAAVTTPSPSPTPPQCLGTCALGWDQMATSLADAQSMIFHIYADGSPGAVLPNVTVTGSTSPYQCQATMPLFSPGLHTITLTAQRPGGPESAQSAAVQFTLILFIGPPQNIWIGQHP